MRLSLSLWRAAVIARLGNVAMTVTTFPTRHHHVCKLFYNDVYEVTLPPTHRFPMDKYKLIRTGLQDEYANNPELSFHVSPLSTRRELETTHCSQYVERFLTEGAQTAAEIRAVGFPWSVAGTRRALSSVGGTVAAMRALLRGEALSVGHLAGGTHHAFFDYGEGFCVFSDIAVAANLALREFPHLVSKVLILDLDVHQGNGNAKLFEKRPEVFTFSMHCRANIFSLKQTSDVDVDVEEGCGDEEYNAKLAGWMPFLFDIVQPQLVFFQAGVDVFEGDRLGRLALTRKGIQRRNAIVLEAAKAAGVPLVLTMGGGYPRGDLADPTLEAYQAVLECHKDCYRQLFETHRQK